MEPTLLADLDLVLSLENRSILSYITDVSTPLALDGTDRAVLEMFRTFQGDAEGFAEALVDLILRAGGEPSGRPGDLRQTFFNFLRPRHLLGRYVALAKDELRVLADVRRRRAEHPEFRDLLDRMIGCKSGHLARTEETLNRLDAEAAATAAAKPEAPASGHGRK